MTNFELVFFLLFENQFFVTNKVPIDVTRNDRVKIIAPAVNYLNILCVTFNNIY